ncbi:MAG: nuclear transport factor 2 family protein [Pseudomonadota bacterium]
MHRIEPHASWQALEDHAAALEAAAEDAVVVALVREVGRHMACEIQGDLPGLMATLTAEPVYHFWGNGDPVVLQGREAVAAFYGDMMSRGGNQFEVVTTKVVADRGSVVTEGQVKQVYTADALRANGIETVGSAAVESSDLWLTCAQLVTVWPHDGGGKLIGEDIYFGQNPMATLTPVRRDELPGYHRAREIAA